MLELKNRFVAKSDEDFSAPLAQLVEHLTLNQLVVGSTPTGRTNSTELVPAVEVQGKLRTAIAPNPMIWYPPSELKESFADMAKLADAQALGACPARGGGSSPSIRTKSNDLVWCRHNLGKIAYGAGVI